jgi:hypothetical protein
MKYLVSFTFLVGIILFASCDKEKNEPSPDEKALLTGGIWRVNSVTVDGVNKNDLFANFVLAFTETGFTASNGDPVWPASGSWVFADADQKSIVRNDGVEVTVQALSESALTLKLSWNKTTLGSGREASLQGSYVFVFRK